MGLTEFVSNNIQFVTDFFIMSFLGVLGIDKRDPTIKGKKM